MRSVHVRIWMGGALLVAVLWLWIALVVAFLPLDFHLPLTRDGHGSGVGLEGRWNRTQGRLEKVIIDRFGPNGAGE